MKRQFANVATHARLAVHKAITLLVLFASGLSGAGAAETLRMVVPSDPGFIDPAYWGSSVDQYLIDNLFPRLFKPAVGDEWRFELDAAKSVDTSDPLKIAFELKPGIMWTGGYGELTADDVKFSYERHLDEDVASYISTEFTAIREVEVTGKYTGIVHLNRPSKTLIPSTLGYTGGAIVSRAAIDSEGGFFEAVPTATAGPYRIKSFEPGQNLVLEKDPAWNGEQGDFEEIVLVPIADENAATLAFAAGEVDLTFDSAGNYENLKAAPPEGGKLQLFQSLAPLWLGITQTHPNLQDIRVRKAIQLAIDVPSIIQAANGGVPTQATGLVAPGSVGYRDVAPFQRDVEKARALIDEAGAEGLELRLDYANYTERSIAGQIIQQNLAEIGLELELNGQDEGTFWAIDPGEGDMQLHLKSWAGNPEAFWFLQYFTEEQVGIWNWEAFVDADYEALLAKAEVTSDSAQRSAIYQDMQAMLEASGSFLFVLQEVYPMLYRDTIVPGILPDGSPVFHKFKKAN